MHGFHLIRLMMIRCVHSTRTSLLCIYWTSHMRRQQTSHIGNFSSLLLHFISGVVKILLELIDVHLKSLLLFRSELCRYLPRLPCAV